MIDNLPDGARIVQDYLKAHGSSAVVQLLPDSTATSVDAAKALGVTVENIGKSVVFGSEKGPIVVVMSGTLRVSTTKLAAVLGGVKLEKMNAVAVKETTGFVIGGVSPFGLPKTATVVVDTSLRKFATVWVAAGHPKAVVGVSFAELLSLSSGTEADVAEDKI